MTDKLFIFFLACFLNLYVSGETTGKTYEKLYSVSLVCPEKKFYLTFDQPTSRYLVLLRDSLYYLHIDSLQWHKIAYDTNQLDGDLDFSLLKILNTASKTYLVLWSGGYVYELKGNSIIRTDKSFNHRSQFGSTKFMMGDTLVSYGGYGFWNYQNFFTYLSPVTLQWEMLELNSDHLPTKRSYQTGYYDPSTRDFFIMTGQTSKFTAKGPFDAYTLNDVWKINLTAKKWRKLGTLNKRLEIGYAFPVIGINDKCLLFNSATFSEIDFNKNRYRYVEVFKNLAEVIYKEKGIGYNPREQEIIYVKYGNNPGHDEIRITPVKRLYSGKITETWLYRNYWTYVEVASLFLMLILVLTYFLWWRKRYTAFNNKLVLHSGSGELKYRSIMINLDEDERKLLAELAKEDRYYNMIELFEIISNGNYSPDALKKQKLKIFNSINKKTDFITKGKTNLFLTRQSPGDKRLVEVKINEGIVRIVR